MTKTISAIAFLMALAFAGSASAATVNIGSTPGTYDVSWATTPVNNNTATGALSGTLAPLISVTFSYALTSGDNMGTKFLMGSGDYGYYQNSKGDVVYTATPGYASYAGGTSIAVPNAPLSIGRYNDGVTSKDLILLTSLGSMSTDGKTGSITFKNMSNGIVRYMTNFTVQVTALQHTAYTYTVTSLAPVPLPAALPLFGGGLVLAGFMRKRKKV